MSFQQGITGLNATSKSLDVIGNNIANSSTVGAKASRIEFADLYSAARGGSSGMQIGSGTAVSMVAQNFSGGNISNTNNPLDMALSGNGFFQVQTPDLSLHYTRNGQFKVNRDGDIVNNQGDKLIGYTADATGAIQAGVAVPMRLLSTGIEPKATSAIAYIANFDSRAGITQPAVPGIDFADSTTYNNATSSNSYDANGKDVIVTTYFQKTAADTWDIYITANGNSISGTPAVKSATLTFDPTGAAVLNPLVPVSVAIPAGPVVNGVGTLAIAALDIDMTKFTQFAASFGVTQASQDGYSAGALTGVNVDSTGLIRASYSNGHLKSVGQLELANFANLNGLQPLGGNEWAKTTTAGDPVLGVAGAGGLGTVQSSALEDSNVDLTSELVNMMVAQRIYQANAQTIKTQDQVLQTLVNLR